MDSHLGFWHPLNCTLLGCGALSSCLTCPRLRSLMKLMYRHNLEILGFWLQTNAMKQIKGVFPSTYKSSGHTSLESVIPQCQIMFTLCLKILYYLKANHWSFLAGRGSCFHGDGC